MIKEINIEIMQPQQTIPNCYRVYINNRFANDFMLDHNKKQVEYRCNCAVEAILGLTETTVDLEMTNKHSKRLLKKVYDAYMEVIKTEQTKLF